MKKRVILVAGAIIVSGAPTVYAECTNFDGVNCISIGCWDWVGGSATGEPNNFLVPANWDFGELFNAPWGGTPGSPASVSGLPVYYGPVAEFINGSFQGYKLPFATAILSSDYTSTASLTLATGAGANLTINSGATYTLSTANIGKKPLNNFLIDNPNANDTAVLNLDNGHIVGSAIVGVDAAGELNVTGNSSITGNLMLAQSTGSQGTLNIATGANWNLNSNLSFGSGNAVINNGSTTTLNSNISNSSASNASASWRNVAGGSLELANTAGFGLNQQSTPTALINDAGATLSKSGAGKESTIGWNVVNNGTIAVEDGSYLIIGGGFSGDGSADLNTSGNLSFYNATLTADAALTVNGGSIGFNNLRGGNTLQLAGNYAIDHAYGNIGTLAANIENAGQALLKETIYNSTALNASASWRNVAGGSLELANNAGFGLNQQSTPTALINDAGATLSKTGAGTASSIAWDVINNGTIETNEGTLVFNSDVSGSGNVQVNANTMLQIGSGSEFQTHTLSVDPTGVLDFNGSRLEVVEFNGNFAQDQGIFAPGASPAVSSLTGNYTMTGSSVFEVELGGTGLGEFDQLSVSGDVTLSHGALAVSLFDGFTVSNGSILNS